MQTIVMFSEQRWQSVARRPGQFVSHLSRRYNVVYVEEPVLSADESRLDATRAAENVTVVVPRLAGRPVELDRPGTPTLAALLRDHLAAHGIHDYLAWFLSPGCADVLAGLSPRATVYDCSDDPEPRGSADTRYGHGESLLMQQADLVIASGPSLCESLRGRHDDVICVPGGVDATRFSPFSAARLPEHVAYAAGLHRGIGYPRLGFHGAIDERLDLELIASLAQANSTWQVVLSGPMAPAVSGRFPLGPNVHVLEPSPPQYLPHVISQWDVGILPYAVDHTTRFLNPTQALQFMAYGRAVVSTPLAEAQALYGDAIKIADGASSFIQACHARAFGRDAVRHRRTEAAARIVERSSWPAAMAALDAALERLHESPRAVPRPPAHRERLAADQPSTGR